MTQKCDYHGCPNQIDPSEEARPDGMKFCKMHLDQFTAIMNIDSAPQAAKEILKFWLNCDDNGVRQNASNS